VDIKAICGFGKPEYFFKRGWTDRNSLIRLEKLDFTRKSAGRAGKTRSPDQANGSGRHDAREAPAGCLRGRDTFVAVIERSVTAALITAAEPFSAT
jgi:hypothetical protein